MRPVALVLAVALVWTPAQPLSAQAAARIVAIGDIHGEFDGFKRILQAAGLTDASGRWSGGRTQFIQTGDYTDRGTGTRQVLDLLMALEPQARRAGGHAFAQFCSSVRHCVSFSAGCSLTQEEPRSSTRSARSQFYCQQAIPL